MSFSKSLIVLLYSKRLSLRTGDCPGMTLVALAQSAATDPEPPETEPAAEPPEADVEPAAEPPEADAEPAGEPPAADAEPVEPPDAGTAPEPEVAPDPADAPPDPMAPDPPAELSASSPVHAAQLKKAARYRQ